MQALKLCKALVEGHELKACRESEGSEVRVAPDFGRKGPALRVAPPERLDVRGFVREGNTRIAEEFVEHPPRVRHRHRFRPKCLGVRGQSQETLLRQAAERATVVRQTLKPIGIVPNYPIGRLTVRAALRGPQCLPTRSVSEGLFPFCRKDLRQSSLTLRVSVERNRRCQGRDAVNPRPWDDPGWSEDF